MFSADMHMNKEVLKWLSGSAVHPPSCHAD